MHIDWIQILHCVSTSSVTSHYLCRGFLQFLQLPVRVEHSCAVMDNASDLLTVVMGLENALMAVMRLDVVSYHDGPSSLHLLHTACNSTAKTQGLI